MEKMAEMELEIEKLKEKAAHAQDTGI